MRVIGLPTSICVEINVVSGTASITPIEPITIRIISVANISRLIIIPNGRFVACTKNKSSGSAAPTYAIASVSTSAPICSRPILKTFL